MPQNRVKSGPKKRRRFTVLARGDGKKIRSRHTERGGIRGFRMTNCDEYDILSKFDDFIFFERYILCDGINSTKNTHIIL